MRGSPPITVHRTRLPCDWTLGSTIPRVTSVLSRDPAPRTTGPTRPRSPPRRPESCRRRRSSMDVPHRCGTPGDRPHHTGGQPVPLLRDRTATSLRASSPVVPPGSVGLPSAAGRLRVRPVPPRTLLPEWLHGRSGCLRPLLPRPMVPRSGQPRLSSRAPYPGTLQRPAAKSSVRTSFS